MTASSVPAQRRRAGHEHQPNVAVLSGLSINVAGMTHNRYCSSGLQAIAIAANQVASGCNDVIVAGGVESITMTLRKSMNTQNLFNPVLQKMCRDLLPHGPNSGNRRASLQRQP